MAPSATARGTVSRIGQQHAAVVAGLCAGGTYVVTTGLLRTVIGALTVPELVEDRLVALIPGSLFAGLLGVFGHLAKPALFALLFLSPIPVGGLAGLLLKSRLRTDLPARAHTALAAALVAALSFWLLAATLGLWLAGKGILGAELRQARLPTLAGHLAAWLIAAGMFWLVAMSRQWLVDGRPASTARRAALYQLGLSLVGLGLVGASWRLVGAVGPVVAVARDLRRGEGILPPEITPNDRFYVVSKNFVDPVVEPRDWLLEIGGLVEHPLALTYDELIALPAVEEVVTLECISNEVGGDLISNARWRGVRLVDLLDRVGIQSTAVELIVRGVDGYSDSLGIDQAHDPATLVAYRMNGEWLPPAHGFPARLVIPGIYGKKHVKWLTRLEAVDYDYKGYWQQQGWSDRAVVKPMARIDVPRPRQRVEPPSVLIGGVAFTGRRGIGAIQLSFDNEKTWSEATVKPPLSPFSWAIWMYDWLPPQPGLYWVAVRVVDGRGDVQPRWFAETFPDG
ncbi:MAG TPA: molybdopterin-dependent oxidoreductase, partial [Dehalococcoidia bacterium]|nr:molybdopterin-dependent oxidoreductase [Dehalococcoidia bacterium]